MNKKLWSGLIIIIAITACSGTPKLETQYFLLTPTVQNQATANDKHQHENSKKLILIEPIKLAEYLDQPGIVLHTGDHQIQVAHYHRWAEPLKQNLRRFILQTLSSTTTSFVFQTDSKLLKKDSALSLSIEVTNFNGTSSGVTLLAGRWMLKNIKTGELMVTEAFHYQNTLQRDGYDEMVAQLAFSLHELCDDIGQSISMYQ